MSPPSPSAELAKSAMRLTAGFLHENHKIGFLVGGDPPPGRTPVTELIALAILQANVAQVLRDPARHLAYGAFEAPPPDRERRPVSIRAVAASLSLSHETTRRHVVRLAEEGLAVITPEGVYVPQSAMASPLYVRGAVQVTEKLCEFHARLVEAGVLAWPEAPPSLEAPFPYRAMMRRFGDYFLRMTDGMNRIVGDLVLSMLLMAMFQESVLEGRRVAVARVAELVRLPHETVRRKVARLEAAGHCRRTPEGLETPPDLLDRPAWAAFCETNLSDLRRFFADLQALGVIDAWKGQGGPTPA